MHRSLSERFWAKVEVGGPDDCWIWTAGTRGKGYGRIWVDGRDESAHRVSAKLAGMDIEGKLVLHRCDNPPCVNPAHLYVGTQRDNARDRDLRTGHPSSLKTHCPHGHPYDEENTHINRRGGRECLTCKRRRSAAWRKRMKKTAMTMILGLLLAVSAGAQDTVWGTVGGSDIWLHDTGSITFGHVGDSSVWLQDLGSFTTGSVGDSDVWLQRIGPFTTGSVGSNDVWLQDLGSFTTGHVGPRAIWIYEPPAYPDPSSYLDSYPSPEDYLDGFLWDND